MNSARTHGRSVPVKWHHALEVIAVLSVLQSCALAADDKMSFWNTQRRGANCFNKVMTADWWSDAKKVGIEFVRLAPNKWASEARDYLIGDADQYNGLVKEDIDHLLNVLADAESNGVKVVVTTLSLPGARWRQQNGDRSDLRLWVDTAYWSQAAAFWRDLALALHGSTNVVAYNILNEPTPELVRNVSAETAAQTLDSFYTVVIQAIREVDSITPVLLDGGDWASPDGLSRLSPTSDNRTLYGVHMYEPFAYTNRKSNAGRYCYPGYLAGELGDSVQLDSTLIEAILRPVADWQRKHGVPSNRIMLAEFGCHRTSCGAAAYLSDVIAVCEYNGWHWAFYAFREDTWDGMDYELGTRPPSWEYWKALERGDTVALPRVDNAVWDVLRHALRRGQ